LYHLNETQIGNSTFVVRGDITFKPEDTPLAVLERVFGDTKGVALEEGAVPMRNSDTKSLAHEDPQVVVGAIQRMMERVFKLIAMSPDDFVVEWAAKVAVSRLVTRTPTQKPPKGVVE